MLFKSDIKKLRLLHILNGIGRLFCCLGILKKKLLARAAEHRQLTTKLISLLLEHKTKKL